MLSRKQSPCAAAAMTNSPAAVVADTPTTDRTSSQRPIAHAAPTTNVMAVSNGLKWPLMSVDQPARYSQINAHEHQPEDEDRRGEPSDRSGASNAQCQADPQGCGLDDMTNDEAGRQAHASNERDYDGQAAEALPSWRGPQCVHSVLASVPNPSALDFRRMLYV